MFTARIPKSNNSFTSFTVKSIERRKIPGIEGIATCTFSPSAINMGNIKSDGLKLVSRTKLLTDSLTRNLLPLCNGNIYLWIRNLQSVAVVTAAFTNYLCYYFNASKLRKNSQADCDNNHKTNE